MARKAPMRHWDDVVRASDRADARTLNRAVQRGELQRIAPSLYVPAGPAAEVEERVRRNWQRVAAALMPEAVVSHLSAFSGGATEAHLLTLSHPTRFNRNIAVPGLKLVVLRGPGNLPGDMKLGEQPLYWSSRPRMVLENLTRTTEREPRAAGRERVEELLVDVLAASGEDALNRLRDDARGLAPALAKEAEFAVLDRMVAALLGTHPKGELRTKAGQLVAQGTPADKERMQRVELLANELRRAVLPSLKDVATAGSAKRNFAFFESYFSNFVEGTKFSIEEAEGIALQNRLVEARPKDSHDIIGVFNLALNSPTRDTVPAPGDAFIEGLQQRHAQMLNRRPEVRPGEFKLQPNFAGTTAFVAPAMVRGTLIEGSNLATSVPEGLARAIYYAFLISEVHPFADGNGRLSRLMLNAELSRLGLCRIIIPTLFHIQYVDCQRALTRNNHAEPFVSAIAKMATWTATFDYSEYDTLLSQLHKANAFEESPAQYKLYDATGAKVA
ncbi:MAG: Fic family protein [Betaproteobacteria bacterium]